MLRILFFSAVIISSILNFVGLFANVFIAVVISKTWKRSHRDSSSERVLLSLGLSRFLMMGLFLLYIVFFFISPYILRLVSVSTLFLLCWMLLDSSSLWFVTLLNTLYCVKISSSQHSLFLLLKRILSPKIPRLLLACVLISAFTTVLYAVFKQKSPSSESVTRSNGTMFDMNEGMLSLVVSLVLSSCLQFIINVTSASLLINSLKRHVQKMKRNATGFWNPQTEAHVGAMKLMIYFLILYIPYSAATLVLYLPSFTELGFGVKSICVIISNLYHPGHSVLIILTHSKLKTKAKQILCFKKQWNFCGKLY